MGASCTRPPAPPPKYSPPPDCMLDAAVSAAEIQRLQDLVKLYDRAVLTGDLPLRGLYASEMMPICKSLGYEGDWRWLELLWCVYSH